MVVGRRGAIGETALHLCFLLNSPSHKRLIELIFLMRWYGSQGAYWKKNHIDVKYSAAIFHGEVCMHFSIVRDELEQIRLL